MFKKLSAVACSCITVLLLLLSLIGGAVHTAAATLDEMTSTAISCIMSHEGSYGSVNRNDCGAVSIGKLQWHAGRALSLLQSICYSAPDLSQSTLGSTLYNEILSSPNWNYRTFTVSEGSAVATLLTTDAGVAAQDALAYSDVQGYIVSGQNKGLVSEGALVMYADIYNFGCGIASRIASRAAGYAGSYGAVSLDDMYRAAMNDSYSSDAAFVQRTNMVYQSLQNMNIGGDVETTAPATNPTDEPTQETTTVVTSDFSDSYAGTYVVTASALNLRSNPSTSASVVATLPRNAVVTVTMANGSWAAVTYEGKNGYCSMDYLTVMPEETTVPEEETTTTTTETTTTTTEMTTISEETTTTETTTMTEAATMETTTAETTAEMTETETSATEETVTTTTAAVMDDNKNHGVTATLYGDVDGDGEVTAIDAVLLQKHINGMVFLSHEQMANADCVADGVLDEADVAVILQSLIGHYTSLPIY
ncbi:MAG: SH3 domain-containing protein [Ruminococcus callidus]|nr:SH3 domain-containing protein [Ruminococcus sp.]MDD6946766.1 SH3 domain-containing protein [Ruminococcus sp.]MDY6145005.1 SH3 domain-containing protein [Ruminococcus callidus]